MMQQEPILNEHNKEEFPPAHTAEHLLNQLMIRLFGTQRSNNAHVERKKSKITYKLDHKPTRKEEKEIETEMNCLIALDMPVSYEFTDRDHLPEGVDADRLPANASEAIRLVRIGDYDVCPCIGKHVRSTAQIGRSNSWAPTGTRRSASFVSASRSCSSQPLWMKLRSIL